MGIALLKKLNTNMPDSVKNAFAPIIRGKLIYSRVFREQINELDKMDSMTCADIEKAQFGKLKITLIHAYEHTEYYKKIFDEIGFNVYGFNNPQQLKMIPVLTREQIAQNLESLSADDVTDYYSATTGGSTGSPLKVYLDRDSIYKEKAFIYHFWSKYGYDYKSSKLASFRGTDFAGKNFKSNPLYNEIQVNPCNININTIKEYCKKIEKFGAEFLHGFPSAIYSFCRFAEEAGINLKGKFKAVFFISENIYDFWRDYIEKTLECITVAFYGHSERAVFAEENSMRGYSFNDFYGYWEVNEKGNIICTGFINQKTLLIRYELDDTAEKNADRYKIVGHRDGILYGDGNSIISLAAMEVHSAILDKVVSYQFIQKEKGKVTVLVVPVLQLSETDVKELYQLFQTKAGDTIRINIEVGERPRLTQRGKFKFLTQEIQ